jgi:hypothetical protein
MKKHPEPAFRPGRSPENMLRAETITDALRRQAATFDVLFAIWS